jgi:hypothetical protein
VGYVEAITTTEKNLVFFIFFFHFCKTTNVVVAVAGYSVASHLVSCPNLTHVILPFASDLVLQNISQSPRLVLFQNVYR